MPGARRTCRDRVLLSIGNCQLAIAIAQVRFPLLAFVAGERAASRYEKPFQHVLATVKPERKKNNRAAYREYWWRHGQPRIAMRSALRGLNRFFATPEVSKHAFFACLSTVILPDKQLIVFARQDDFSFGVLASGIHAVWAFAQGTQVREKESGFRYTPTTCFETFPFSWFNVPIPLPIIPLTTVFSGFSVRVFRVFRG